MISAIRRLVRLETLMADFYNATEEGVLDDRWRVRESIPAYYKNAKETGLIGAIKTGLRHAKDWNHRPPIHFDFTTPEYQIYHEIVPKKWEANRGIGWSFGINYQETEADYISYTELIRLFVDIVSKNGNLLLNVGPNPDGTIHPIQTQRLEQLGNWLAIHGEGIYETRPWIELKVKLVTEMRFVLLKKMMFSMDLPFKISNNMQGKNSKLLIFQAQNQKLQF